MTVVQSGGLLVGAEGVPAPASGGLDISDGAAAFLAAAFLYILVNTSTRRCWVTASVGTKEPRLLIISVPLS